MFPVIRTFGDQEPVVGYLIPIVIEHLMLLVADVAVVLGIRFVVCVDGSHVFDADVLAMAIFVFTYDSK